MSYYLIGDSGTVAFKPYVGVIDSEEVVYSNKVTSNPIEGGGTIDDHAVADPFKVSISGVITKPIGTEEATLRAMAENRDLLSYKGAKSYSDMVITSLSSGRSAGLQGGFTFKISLQHMQITSPALAPVAQFMMSSGDRGASSGQPGAKPEENVGQTTPSGGYADYVNSFNDPQPRNPDIDSARTNPHQRGYK